MSEWTLNGGEGYGRHWIEVADEMERNDGTPPVTPVTRPAAMDTPPVRESIADRLCNAERPRESISAVLDEAARLFDNCILFQVQQDAATVWDVRGPAAKDPGMITFTESSVSGNPLELLMIHPSYRGLTPVEQAYVPFFEQLGVPFPAEISLTPIEVNGRMVAILYGDCGEEGRLRSTEQQDLTMARRLGLGFALVLIKNKIRALGDA